jgi:putative oxidoreductase
MHCAPSPLGKHLPRVFLSLLFIVSGVGFLENFSGTVGFVSTGLSPLGLESFAVAATVIVLLVKIGAGLMLLLNIRPQLAAGFLIAFVIAATALYHTSWAGAQGSMQMTQFFKNLAIIGGLLLVAHGCGCSCSGCRRDEAKA